MDITDITSLVRFVEGREPHREILADTPRLRAEVVSLQQNQQTEPTVDPDADVLFTTVAGEVVIWMDRSHKRLKQWHSVVAPAGASVVLRSASTEPSVVLAVAATTPAS